MLFYVKITIVVGTLIFDRYLSKNQELRHLADSDSMTNLFNRGKIEDEIQLVLKKQLINRAAFILFDVDKFKLVNDTLGHIAGDELIKMIAARMHKEFRKGDLLGRLGGDEFVIFLSEVTDDAVLRNKMNYFSDCVSEIGEMMHWPIDVSISYGIACYPENGQSFESLYQYADELMYIQKSEKS